MVEKRLRLEPEVQEIFKYIDAKRNFLLSGGAGSGKTYSLVQVIRQAIDENPTAKIACITYTNAAIREIQDRVTHNNLAVSTIHDFLWDNIKHFQKELKSAIINLINDPEVTLLTIGDGLHVPHDFFSTLEQGIQYTEYLKLAEGKISHDELLVISHYLFQHYPRLSEIIKDKYRFILVDEYQDTSKNVVEILLNHVTKSDKHNTIGFFGDAMQSIYDDTIGNLDDYKGNAEQKVAEVKRVQNRRSPKRIIDLANKLRTDGIIQEPSNDLHAPNMKDGLVKEGSVTFLYSTDGDLDKVRTYLAQKQGWDFSCAEKTKELNLTHNLIAGKAGFRSLMDVYDKDGVLAFRDRIKKYIKDTKIDSDYTSYTFGEVVAELQQGKDGRELTAVKPTPLMQTFIDANPDLYLAALQLNFGEFSKLFVDKDQLVDDKKTGQLDASKKGSKRDNLIKHLYKIQTNISLYTQKNYNEFLRVTDYRERIFSIEDKIALKENIESLVEVGDKTIEQVINDADDLGICQIDDRLTEFIAKKDYLYNRVKQIKFAEFQKLYEYLEGRTPFSTQHKTKGAEFDNVLVILDNGNWNHYNFEKLFLGGGTANVLERTRKIFYVCCTRSKESLAVYFHNPKPEVVEKAEEWFGNNSVIQVS
jgi:DNA helicase-2/ATP-dependent DNA helicase PcrA